MGNRKAVQAYGRAAFCAGPAPYSVWYQVISFFVAASATKIGCHALPVVQLISVLVVSAGGQVGSLGGGKMFWGWGGGPFCMVSRQLLSPPFVFHVLHPSLPPPTVPSLSAPSLCPWLIVVQVG